MRGCRPLADSEVKAVSDSFSGRYASRDRALFILGVRTGFRVSELLSVRVRDILQANRIVERLTVRRRNVKRRTEGRTVLLHPEAKAAVRTWLDELQADGAGPMTYLFRSHKGRNRPISRQAAHGVLKAAYLAAGITGNLGTHSMRKTFAHKVHEALGRDIFRTQKALGHRQVETTIKYLSFDESDIDAAILAA